MDSWRVGGRAWDVSVSSSRSSMSRESSESESPLKTDSSSSGMFTSVMNVFSSLGMDLVEAQIQPVLRMMQT
jgi:hypothetical protein